MSIKPIIQAKTEAVLEREALTYGVNATALAKAIVETVVSEGIIHQTLAGVDVESFQGRKKGRKPGNGQYQFQGKLRSLSGISKITGVPFDTIRGRLLRGWELERAATTPKMPKGFPNKKPEAAL